MTTKLRQSIACIERVASLSGGRALVAFSGGKDSLVVLDLAVQVLGAKNVDTFFLYLVNGLKCVEAPINAALARYGIERHHRVPHWELARHLREGNLCPPRGDASAIRALRAKDIEALVRKKSGVDWILNGWRKSDSFTRRIALNRSGLIWEPSRRAHPIADWLTGDVQAYMHARKIPQPPRIGTDNPYGVSGVGLAVSQLRWLRAHAPDDWVTFCEVFPYAPASLLRAELHPDLYAEAPPKPKKPKAPRAPCGDRARRARGRRRDNRYVDGGPVLEALERAAASRAPKTDAAAAE